MKEYIDFCATLQGELLAKKKLERRMRAYWGTTYVDGVHVYNSTFTLWPGTDSPRVSKVAKMFNVKLADIRKQSKKGLDRIYLKLSSSKADSSATSKEALATMLEREIPFNEERVFSLTYTDVVNPTRFNGMTKEDLIKYVEDNYSSDIYGKDITAFSDKALDMRHRNKVTNMLVSSGETDESEEADESIEDYIGIYILLDNGVDFKATIEDASVVPVPVATVQDSEGSWNKPSSMASGFTIKVRYERTGYLNDKSPIVEAIHEDLQNPFYSNTENAFRLLSTYDKKNKTDSIWYKGYLRVATAKNLKKYDYANTVYKSVEVDYKIKKTKTWKKVVGVVLTVIAVVVTVMTAGAASPLVAIAQAATAAVIVASLTSFIMAKHGDFDGATYMGRWVKVAGIVALVAGIAAAIQSLMREAAKQAIQQGAGQAAGQATGGIVVDGISVQVSEITVENIIDAAMKMAADSGVGASVLDTLSAGFKVVDYGMKQREKNKQDKLDRESKAVKEQQEELARLYDKNLHLGLEDIRTYTRPLTEDNAQFEVDYLYEGMKFHILRPSFARYGLNIISDDIN